MMTTVCVEQQCDGSVTLVFTRPDHKGVPRSVSATFSVTSWVEFVEMIMGAALSLSAGTS